MITLQIQLDRPLIGAEIISAADLDLRQTQAINSEAANQSELGHLIKSIQAAVDSLQTQAQHSKQQLATAAVKIASIVMQRITGDSETLAADRLELLILEALDRPDTPIAIQLNAQDLSIVEPMIEKAGLPTNKLELIASQNIGKGECRCEYDGYALTSDLSEQIKSIEDRLLEVIND